MNLTKCVENLKGCLVSKVAVEQKIRNPSVELDFEVKTIPSDNTIKMILAAVDRKTGTFLYIAEIDKNSPTLGKWTAKGSEFYDRIYVFANKIIEELEYMPDFEELSVNQQSKALEKLAAKIYNSVA